MKLLLHLKCSHEILGKKLNSVAVTSHKMRLMLYLLSELQRIKRYA